MGGQVGSGRVDLAIVGGGVAGLAAAVAAHRAGWSVCLVEADEEVGGKMRSIRQDGWLMERGPSSFMSSASAIWELIEAVGLDEQVVSAQPPAWRFIYRGGRARKLPTGPGSALFGDWLSLGGKMRVLAEPFIGGAPDENETLADFMKRRLGAGAAADLVGPFVSGVHAGDPSVLGARDAFPKLWRFENDAGSIVRGALKAKKAAKAAANGSAPKRKRGMYNLRDGLGSLASAITEWLPPGSVRTGTSVAGIDRQANDFVLTLSDGEAAASLSARRLILATPASAAATLLTQPLPEAAELLGGVKTCAMVVVHMGGEEREGLTPRGFGALIKRGEDVRTLGVLLPSSLFPGRAPPGHWLNSAFIGGALDPEAVELPDDELVALARTAQRQVFGLPDDDALPLTFHKVLRWHEAIPQYVVGHRNRVGAALAAVERDLPGATLAGSYVDGVSMADAASSGLAAVARLQDAGVPS